MSWLFSRVLVEEYLGANCSDGEQSAPSNGNPIPRAYCVPDKMTAFLRLSRFGMTFAPLTADRGQELLMSYLEGFHAKTSAQPDEAQELMGSDQECGDRWRGSLAKYDPNTSSWKIPQCSLLEDSEECLEIWPRSGMTRDGLCWELPTLGRRTKETESGSWPTPRSCSAMAATITPESAWAENRFPNLETVVGRRIWPTPTCNMVSGGPNHNSPQVLAGNHGINLAGAVMKWPMPTAHMAKETNAPSGALRNEPTLASRVGGQLNPTWVEWLIGWPLGWTDLKPLETDKCPSVPQQHGDC